jgi:hypothetical protein
MTFLFILVKLLRQEKRLYICEECNERFNHLHSFSIHIRNIHDRMDYFDKWIRDDEDGKCKICGQKTKFISIGQGYEKCCCKKHIDQYSYKCRKEKLFKNKGVENPYQIEEAKQKLRNTWIKIYGVDNPSKNKIIKNKKEKTCLKNHGVTAGFADSSKRKYTWNKKYGVDNPQQNPDIFKKGQKTRFEINKFRNTNLWYQGSYELDFLNRYYDIFPDIQRGPSIKYIYNGKDRVYHSDFYILSFNLVIECKNSYLYKKFKENIEEKARATINMGYNYILIIDQNYKLFNKLINETHGS